jgi:FkbM family methyltransferase
MSSTPLLAKLIWRQNWIPLRLKKTAYKTLSKSGQAPSAPFESDFYGLRYRGNLNNGIEFALFYYGAFEKPLLYFLRDCLLGLGQSAEEKLVFCDVGANIGQHSLFMSRFAQQVHAFEPFSEVSARLDAHIKLNKIDNIRLHPLGLSDENGSLPFFAPAGSNRGVGSFVSDSIQRGNQAIGELRIARADDYFREQEITRVDLIKIDVEGFEARALAGMREILRQQRPVVVCEVSYGEELSFGSREAFLASLPDNYCLYCFDTRKPDGSTARRRGARAKRSGRYALIPLTHWRDRDQDDLVAIPKEKLARVPLRGPLRK